MLKQFQNWTSGIFFQWNILDHSCLQAQVLWIVDSEISVEMELSEKLEDTLKFTFDLIHEFVRLLA